MSQFFADISAFEPGYHPAKYASAGYAAIAIKATEGHHYVNPYYVGRNWVRDSHRHNLAVFHYHFCRPENGNPVGQAHHFWDVVAPHFRRPGDYVVCDLETGDPGEARRWLVEFESTLRARSMTHPVLYTYLSFLQSGGLTIPSRNIWLAAYQRSRPGSFRWRLGNGQNLWAWQYTDGNGHGPGPQSYVGVGRCDGSILNPSVYRILRIQRTPR